ncbi:MAG: nucleotidyltransferase family protein [Elusimicrobia bacterium]|nr:nucleotidyltransferase family protein [Elusimicrobiota bacterium]
MKQLEKIKRTLAQHKQELRNDFYVNNIGVFGSYVRGDQTNNSDLDILVDFEKPVGWEIVDLRDRLNELLGMKVDLVIKGAASRKPLLWKSIQEDLVYV